MRKQVMSSKQSVQATQNEEKRRNPNKKQNGKVTVKSPNRKADALLLRNWKYGDFAFLHKSFASSSSSFSFYYFFYWFTLQSIGKVISFFSLLAYILVWLLLLHTHINISFLLWWTFSNIYWKANKKNVKRKLQTITSATLTARVIILVSIMESIEAKSLVEKWNVR